MNKRRGSPYWFGIYITAATSSAYDYVTAHVWWHQAIGGFFTILFIAWALQEASAYFRKGILNGN